MGVYAPHIVPIAWLMHILISDAVKADIHTICSRGNAARMLPVSLLWACIQVHLRLLCRLSFMLLFKWALNGHTTASVDAPLYNLAWILP